jgi:hypothetical protein
MGLLRAWSLSFRATARKLGHIVLIYIYIYRSPFPGQIQQAVISIVTYYTSCLSEDSPNAHDSNPKQCWTHATKINSAGDLKAIACPPLGEVHTAFFNGHCSRLFATSLPLAKGLGLALGWLLITIQSPMRTTSNSWTVDCPKSASKMNACNAIILSFARPFKGSQLKLELFPVQFLPT